VLISDIQNNFFLKRHQNIERENIAKMSESLQKLQDLKNRMSYLNQSAASPLFEIKKQVYKPEKLFDDDQL